MPDSPAVCRARCRPGYSGSGLRPGRDGRAVGCGNRACALQRIGRRAGCDAEGAHRKSASVCVLDGCKHTRMCVSDGVLCFMCDGRGENVDLFGW
jgi:hypothetical protein